MAANRRSYNQRCKQNSHQMVPGSTDTNSPRFALPVTGGQTSISPVLKRITRLPPISSSFHGGIPPPNVQLVCRGESVLIRKTNERSIFNATPRRDSAPAKTGRGWHAGGSHVQRLLVEPDCGPENRAVRKRPV